MKNYRNIGLILVVLIVAFILITYLRNINLQEKSTQGIPSARQTCEDKCDTETCLYSCYSDVINIAVAEKNLAKCNEISPSPIQKSCFDEVNLALGNCDKISSLDLKALCQK